MFGYGAQAILTGKVCKCHNYACVFHLEKYDLHLNSLLTNRRLFVNLLGNNLTQGPFENLCDHLSNPTGANILTNFAHPFGNGSL